MLKVIRFYLKEKGSGGTGWSYPDLLREGRPEEEIEVELEIEDALWREMRAEAARQRVSVTQLLEHAALYYAAELDAGRLTERILDELVEPGLNAGCHHRRRAQFGELRLQGAAAAMVKAVHGALRLFQRGGDFDR